MSQPLNGISKKPLVFAQITNGISCPKIIKARIISSSRVIDIKSNMFLHLFYNKPYMKNMGYNHAVDRENRFRIKACPSIMKSQNQEIMASGFRDVGNQKTNNLSEMQLLTLSEVDSWNFKPTVRVAEWFAKSLGAPIDCWTACSRMKIFRELCEADRIQYEMQCNLSTDSCSLTAGELAKSLHDGDRDSFDPYDDISGQIELSILFVNESPDIQSLDFRCRLNILPCFCEPTIALCEDGTHTHIKRGLDNLYTLDLDENGEEQVLNIYNIAELGLRKIKLRYKQLELGVDPSLIPAFKDRFVWIDRRGSHLPICYTDKDGKKRFIEPNIEKLGLQNESYRIFKTIYTPAEADEVWKKPSYTITMSDANVPTVKLGDDVVTEEGTGDDRLIIDVFDPSITYEEDAGRNIITTPHIAFWDWVNKKWLDPYTDNDVTLSAGTYKVTVCNKCANEDPTKVHADPLAIVEITVTA